ncbi:MAG: discoidin domain-containing protein [Lachnospiraceae bacterium]|nr:discoidin domain-containing protein [Lachnospiraceae bacterium]
MFQKMLIVGSGSGSGNDVYPLRIINSANVKAVWDTEEESPVASGFFGSDERFVALRSVDGSNRTAWMPPNQRNTEHYIIYKLVKLSNIQKISFIPTTADFSNYNATVNVYLSETNNFGSAVATKSFTTSNSWNTQDVSKKVEIDIPNVSAQYIKIGITTTSGTDTYSVGIGEIEAIGTEI